MYLAVNAALVVSWAEKVLKATIYTRLHLFFFWKKIKNLKQNCLLRPYLPVVPVVAEVTVLKDCTSPVLTCAFIIDCSFLQNERVAFSRRPLSSLRTLWTIVFLILNFFAVAGKLHSFYTWFIVIIVVHVLLWWKDQVKKPGIVASDVFIVLLSYEFWPLPLLKSVGMERVES